MLLRRFIAELPDRRTENSIIQCFLASFSPAPAMRLFSIFSSFTHFLSCLSASLVSLLGHATSLRDGQPMRQVVVWRPQMVVIVELIRNGGNDESKKIPGDDRYDRMP